MPPRSSLVPALTFAPTDFHLFAGLPVPDPITFVLSPKWLGRPNLYPRQATLLKVIFLRVDLLTDYDLRVIEEWEVSFRKTGNNGITPGIIPRMHQLRREGYLWFREVLLVLGRRAGKGYVSALAMAYVLWNYLALGDPQGHFGVDRDKQLACFIYAGKKEQARENLWKDLVNVIQGGECFSTYISRPLGETLSVFAPHDFVRMRQLQARGIQTERDMATFLIQPKEATLMSGRGPTSFMQGYDEMAHVVASGANRSAEEVYCLDPATKVLGADLVWRAIKELQPGDKLVGFDEFAEPGKQRKLRESTVKAKWVTRGMALRLTFEDGSSVVCSPNHRWFRVDEGCNNGKWIKAGRTERIGSAGNFGHLQVGDRIRHLVDPWETDDTRNGGYLAGILDGEGWVSSPKTSAFKVGIAQNPGLVLDKTCELLKQFGFEYYQWNKHASRQSDCEQVEVRGLADTLRILGQFRPERLGARAAGLWQDKTPRGTTKFKTIISIEELPEQDLIDIETTTKTFIAEGLVSHNSAATPALDQFKKWAFIIEPSSPWQMIGQFYQNYENCTLEDDEGNPVYPNMFALQLCSWEMYYDWDCASEIELFPPEFEGDLEEYAEEEHPRLPAIKGAIQEYDDGMQKLERANPDTFAVERRSHWQATMDAYLNPNMVDAMFGPSWDGRQLEMQSSGLLSIFYKGHADPSLANANFGLAIAHPEKDANGVIHCVFDYIHHWSPSDFPENNNLIDYIQIDDHLWRIVKAFMPDEFTFDQWNSANSIARLNDNVRKAKFPKRVIVYEKTATNAHNWERAENFKIGLNQGWIHAPEYEQAKLELKFLQLKNGNKVEKQDAGPIQTKDVADCMMECAWTILGEQVRAWTHGALSSLGLRAHVQGGFDPHQRETAFDDPVLQQLSSQRGRSQQYGWRGGGRNPSRNVFANRNRR